MKFFLLALALVAAVHAEPEAEADPWYGYSSLGYAGYGGYGGYGAGYYRPSYYSGYGGYGYGYPHRAAYRYWKRSADAEPEAEADPWGTYGYGGYGLGYSGYGGYGGYGYARPYAYARSSYAYRPYSYGRYYW